MLPGLPLIVFPLPLLLLLLLWLIVSKPLQIRYWARYQHHHWGRALSLEGEKDRHDSCQERGGERSGRERRKERKRTPRSVLSLLRGPSREGRGLSDGGPSLRETSSGLIDDREATVFITAPHQP